MFKKLRGSFLAFGAFVLGLAFFAPLVLGDIFASSLGETGILFETMEVNTSNVGLRGSVTPTTSFASGGTLKISFVDSSLGDWCKAATVSLTVTGIEVPLPGTLVGTCYQHSNGDYIEITGVGALTSGTTYGFEITKHANLSTGPDIGSNRVLLEVSSGSTAQSKLFSIYLMSNDKVQIVAEVSDADSVVCTISDTAVPLGVLYRGGAYVTASHTLGTSTTGGSRGFYWTVFGFGDGTDAGLKSTNYLIKSLNNTVNLLTGEGFGLVVNPNTGASVPADFATGSMGIFGSVRSGFDNARMILYRTSEQTAHEDAVVTVAARASADAEVGEYTETLTYSCGAYLGGYQPLDLLVTPTTLDFGTIEEMKMFTISNSGTGTLEWEIGETIYVSGAGWVIDVDPVAGESRSSEDSVAVSVNRELLSIGNYEATIPVTSLGGGNQNVTILLEKIASLLKIFTKEPYDIATTSAKSGGNITNDGGSSVIARGVCYGTVANPTTPCTSNGIGTGEFISEMTSLNLGTRYYVRAYGENGGGITYGDEFNFITLSTISANPENRDWDNTNVEVTITAIGPDIPQIDYCWTVENTCAPDTFVVENPTNVTQTQNGEWNLCYRYRDADGKKSDTFCSGPYKILADIAGHAWSGKFGWISFSCKNDNTCSTSDYGVTLEDSEFMGYAWSKSYGWMSFNCANDDSCATSNYKVTLSDGALSGYAWSGQFGWVDFSSVTFNSSTGEFSGSAYGLGGEDEISLNCADKGVCATSNYKVEL